MCAPIGPSRVAHDLSCETYKFKLMICILWQFEPNSGDEEHFFTVHSKEALKRADKQTLKLHNENNIGLCPRGLCYNSISLYLKYQRLYEFKYFNLKKNVQYEM